MSACCNPAILLARLFEPKESLQISPSKVFTNCFFHWHVLAFVVSERGS